VRQAFEQLTHLNLNPQFLPDFPGQALFKGFFSFALAARKLPKSAEVCARVTLGDKQFAAAENQGGSNVDDGISGQCSCK